MISWRVIALFVSVGGFCLGGSAAPQRDLTGPVALSIDNWDSGGLRLSYPSHWNLHIYKNGGARLSIGATVGDHADIKIGTYDFNDVIQAARRKIEPVVDSNREPISISLINGDGRSEASGYIQDAEWAYGLLAVAVKAASPFDNERFNEFIRRYPPVPLLNPSSDRKLVENSHSGPAELSKPVSVVNTEMPPRAAETTEPKGADF